MDIAVEIVGSIIFSIVLTAIPFLAALAWAFDWAPILIILLTFSTALEFLLWLYIILNEADKKNG
jgi:heme/copper-type cytochrome/quinol oxidase subunit 4